jgi:outer membrane receptor protein involved in Fe transport
VSTAFTVPAFAQIETVVVTAERKAEDIQSVPVAVTALTGADLKAKQVTNFRDLQFHVPSVTYTKHQFGGAQFQIRGITTQYGLGAAIATNENDIYLEAPALVTGEYFDVDRVEIARGPQSTTYGRAATGGSVNIVTTKPNLDEFAAFGSFDYGTFNTIKGDLMANVPVVDGELGVRLAAHASFHDGYEKNIYSGPNIYPFGPINKRVNGLGTITGRASIRWQPNSDTTVDLIGEYGFENDNRVRGDAQRCHRDPGGVSGCLPDALGLDNTNTLGTFGATFPSKQGMYLLFQSLIGIVPGFTNGSAAFLGSAMGLGSIGGNGSAGDPAGPAGAIFNIGTLGTPAQVNAPGSNPGTIPSDPLTVDTPFNPDVKGHGLTLMFNWAQTVTSWLKSTVDLGYVEGVQDTTQAFQMVPPENISGLITSAVTGFQTVAFLSGFSAAPYNTNYFNVPGALPLSSIFYNGHYGSYGGIIDTTRGGVLTRTPYQVSYDRDYFTDREMTGEVRFQTAFDGPFQLSAGLFYMAYRSNNQYWVVANSLDMSAIAFGAAFGGAAASVAADPTFDAEYRRGDVQSRSAFLEGSYDILPDTLKFTMGARYNDDRNNSFVAPTCIGAALLTNVSPPADPNNPLSACGSPTTAFHTIGATNVTIPFTKHLPTAFVPGKQVTVNDKWTGRMLLDWTPKLNWTDQTLVYASLSRGVLSGGINNTNLSGLASIVPQTYKPATVDAVEVGTKNTLLDGTLQANLAFWYYNYENYQVAIIANRQSLELNVPAHLYGAEGEFIWQPTDDLAFNMTISVTRSEVGNTFLVDQRNLTNGVANSILIKDISNGSSCVISPTTAAAAGHTPGESNPLFHINNFYLPLGGNAAVSSPFGVPLENYGVCNGAAINNSAAVAAIPPAGPGLPPTCPVGPVALNLISATLCAPSYNAQLAAAGFRYAEQINPATGAGTGIFNGTGNARNLHGNKLPAVPNAQIGVGGQYTMTVNDNWKLVPRLDYYWQSSIFTRIWNDNSDYVASWDTMNAQIRLSAEDERWYAMVYAKNIFDKRNTTGMYLQDPSAGLYTNLFVEDPRVFGLSVGVNW